MRTFNLKGNCYRFNSGRNATGQTINDELSFKPGYLNGLQLGKLFTFFGEIQISLGIFDCLRALCWITDKCEQLRTDSGIAFARGQQNCLSIFI
jgi:hypothetical protein